MQANPYRIKSMVHHNLWNYCDFRIGLFLARMAQVSKALRISVAIPLYNEERVIPELLHRVGIILDGIPGGPHEIMLVDDGSSDRTFELATDAATRDPRIVAISLSRNFGHQSA